MYDTLILIDSLVLVREMLARDSEFVEMERWYIRLHILYFIIRIFSGHF